MLIFRNKVGGEEEERRHSLFDVEFIQKLLFTARTKISIQLFISGSLDSLNKWKKRDLEGALIPACVATALPQIPSERTGHVFLTAMQDGQFSSGIFVLALGFQPRCTKQICLQPPTLAPAAAFQCSAAAPHQSPKTSTRRMSQDLDATNLEATI